MIIVSNVDDISYLDIIVLEVSSSRSLGHTTILLMFPIAGASWHGTWHLYIYLKVFLLEVQNEENINYGLGWAIGLICDECDSIRPSNMNVWLQRTPEIVSRGGMDLYFAIIESGYLFLGGRHCIDWIIRPVVNKHPCPISPWTRWTKFRRRYFKIHFLEWKVSNFDENFTEVCSPWSNWIR